MNTLSAIVFESISNWPIAAAALVVLSAMMLWFYPRQIREAGPIGWLLPVLRWCGLSALALMLLKPVFTQTAERIAAGQVIAVVDTSRSMGLVDSARTPAERVALARAFGKLPTGGRDEASTRLLSRIREVGTYAQNVVSAQNDLDYARLVGRGVNAKQTALSERTSEYSAAAQALVSAPETGTLDGIAALKNIPTSDARVPWSLLQQKIRDLEASAAKLQTTADETLYLNDQNVRKVCEGLASQTRLDLALEALNIDRSALSMQESELRVFTVGRDLIPLETSHKIPNSASPVRTTTTLVDVAAALGSAETLAAEQSARAIVLLTDGHRGGVQSSIASAVRPSGVPVYPVNVASSHISDAWISSISPASTAVFRGQNVEGQVEVQYQGNVTPPTMLTVTAQGTGATVSVPLRPRSGADAKGDAKVLIGRYSISVAPPPGVLDELLRFSLASEAGEATLENNVARRWVKVYSNKVRVTLISGGPTWDVQNLLQILRRMPWVELNAVILPSADALLKVTAAQLLQDDIVILHDVPVRALDAGQWDAVGRMVNDRGGSVIVIAGTGVALSDYASQPLAAGLLPFHDLRPVWRQWPGDQGAFHFTPTQLGFAAALNIGDPAETARSWSETLNTFRYLQLPEKNVYPDVGRWLVESDSASPVITERQRGNGRLIFIGLDELWRWGVQGGEPFDQRIWQQTIHHATGLRSLISTPDMMFDLDYISVEPGVSTRARVWLQNAAPTQRTIQVELQLQGKPVSQLTLTGSGGGRFEGPITVADAGDYTLRLHGPGRGGRGRGDAGQQASLPLHVGSDDVLGFINLATDPSLLDHIARGSGGRLLTIDQIDELPRLLREVRVEDSQLARTPIYTSPMLMVFVLACLSAEWALRKRAGLS